MTKRRDHLCKSGRRPRDAGVAAADPRALILLVNSLISEGNAAMSKVLSRYFMVAELTRASGARMSVPVQDLCGPAPRDPRLWSHPESGPGREAEGFRGETRCTRARLQNALHRFARSGRPAAASTQQPQVPSDRFDGRQHGARLRVYLFLRGEPRA